MTYAIDEQGADGRPHLTYFREDVQRSYVWDGRAGFLEVRVDGYGGDLAALAMVPVAVGGAYGLAEGLEVMWTAADREANVWASLALSYGRSLVWWAQRVARVDGDAAARRWLLGATVSDVTGCFAWLESGGMLPAGDAFLDGPPELGCPDEVARDVCRRAGVPAHARLNLEGAGLAYCRAIRDAWVVALRCNLAAREAGAKGGAK